MIGGLTASQFTFHYASTLSLFATRFPDMQSHLPSTMLLLYPGCSERCRNSPDVFTFHYASTLSGWKANFSFMIMKFTFHYASTLSRTAITASDAGLNLHSTMLLLYPAVRVRARIFCFIYIPLCFYFIIRREQQSCSKRINLHSTMLLLYRIL